MRVVTATYTCTHQYKLKLKAEEVYHISNLHMHSGQRGASKIDSSSLNNLTFYKPIRSVTGNGNAL